MLSTLGVGSALAGPCPVRFPTSKGTGTVAGVAVAGGTQYYFKDALLSGFDCFEQLSAWFPSYQNSSNAIAPGTTNVDMAYTTSGSATFSNVVVPTPGNYTLTFHYAFQQGLFPGVLNRPEGIEVNGTVITSDLSFPQTGDFNTFDNLSMLVPLHAGQNTIQIFNVATQSVSRMDAMTVTEGGVANCSVVPGVPTSPTATEDFGDNAIKLQWGASTSTSGCAVGYYNVYRSNSSVFTPSPSNQIATVVSGTSFTDTTASCTAPSFYVVAASNFAGLSGPTSAIQGKMPACPTSGSAQIAAGGPGAGTFSSDVDFSGGGISTNTTKTINLSGATGAAPYSVYNASRNANNGPVTYTLSGFVAGSSHLVRLHFVEPYFSAINDRTFNISINGTVVRSNFDIFGAAGKNKLLILEFTEPADDTGTFTIQFTSVINSALVNAIEVK